MSDDCSNPCKCAPNSSGPTKSNASSFGFQMCDGDEVVNVPASNVADYIINVIYGDSGGNPPAAGDYLISFDGNGVRTITNFNSPDSKTEYVLKEHETIIPTGGVTDQTRVPWNFSNPSFFAFEQQPPAGSSPNFAKIRFRSFFSNRGEIDIRDKFNNPVYHIKGWEEDDDTIPNTDDALVPLDFVGGEYGITISASQIGEVKINASLIGYVDAFILNPDGSTSEDIVSGGTVTPSTPSSADPLTITHIDHTYDSSGNDVTVVEWINDDTFTSSDTYTIYFDLGETIESHTLNHVDGLTSDKQRLTVTWNTLHTLKVDVMVSDGTNNGPVISSNLGSSDNSIPVAFQDTTNI